MFGSTFIFFLFLLFGYSGYSDFKKFIFTLEIFQQVFFYQVLAHPVTIGTYMVNQRPVASVITVRSFFSGVAVDNGTASGSRELLAAYWATDKT